MLQGELAPSLAEGDAGEGAVGIPAPLRTPEVRTPEGGVDAEDDDEVMAAAAVRERLLRITRRLF